MSIMTINDKDDSNDKNDNNNSPNNSRNNNSNNNIVIIRPYTCRPTLLLGFQSFRF